MAIRKVSLNHPHFRPDKQLNFAGIGYLTNDGTPVEVDEDEFHATTGRTLDEAFAKDAMVTVEGLEKPTPDSEDKPPLTSADLGLDLDTNTTSNTEGGETNG